MDRLQGNGALISQVNQGTTYHSSFDLRNHNFFSGKLGKLIVTRLDEVYPGDKIVGSDEAVVNFEPLAVPIMGNMAIKQESFYVPMSILWKNAHKLFTGKNEFAGSVPTISPFDLFYHFSELLHIPAPQTFDPHNTIMWANGESFVGEITEEFGVCASYIKEFGDTYQVFDLLKPIYDAAKKIADIDDGDLGTTTPSILVSKSDMWKEFNAVYNMSTLNLMDGHVINVLTYVLDFYYLFYTTYFGPSSHLDYMGWPVFDNWTRFVYGTGTDVPADTWDENSIAYSYFFRGVNGALPPRCDEGICFSKLALSVLPLRAAYCCWYWNYRDELLETSAPDPEDDETFMSDSVSDFWCVLLSIIRVRCWSKDRFTTALTNTGNGNLQVPIDPTASDGFLVDYYKNDTLIDTKDYQSAFEAGATACSITMSGITYRVPMNYLSTIYQVSDLDTGNSFGLSLDMFDRISRLRKFIQRKLVLGYEYDDVIWAEFAVKLSNVRMRIPELLGRGRDTIAINTIVNNTTIPDGQVAGDKAAVAYGNGKSSHINYFVEEHGYFIQFFTIMPLQSYTGGMSRLYMKHEQFDFMWPVFATMGMDAVYNFELSAPRGQGTLAYAGLSDDAAMAVFGYQGRYSDLKTKLDEAHGRFRTDWNYYLFSREFNMDELPKLNYQFVHCFPSLDMFVTDDENQDIFKVDMFHGLDFERRLPVPSEYV